MGLFNKHFLFMVFISEIILVHHVDAFIKIVI